MHEITGSAASFANRTLADIAATLPGATSVFRRHKLDFCCGGRVALAEAASDRGMQLHELETELDAVAALALPAERPEATLHPREQVPWRARPSFPLPCEFPMPDRTVRSFSALTYTGAPPISRPNRTVRSIF